MAGNGERPIVPPSVRGIHLPTWPRQRPARIARAAFLAMALPVIVHGGYQLEAEGLEHLAGLSGPVLFAANHNWHLDNGYILAALPARWRRRLAIAASADDIFGSRLIGTAAALLGNAFPIARDRGIRTSLDHVGQLLDEGWSVLIYPEGRLTVGGPVQPFKAGTGLVAVESGSPVVPIFVDVPAPGFREGVLTRGRAVVRFGPALWFERGVAHQAATRQLEEAVRRLDPHRAEPAREVQLR